MVETHCLKKLFVRQGEYSHMYTQINKYLYFIHEKKQTEKKLSSPEQFSSSSDVFYEVFIYQSNSAFL